MGIKGFIVRMLPFVGTFALGLFIASFFVEIGGTAYNTRRGRCHEVKRLRMDNQDLRNENLRLRNEIENFDRSLNDLNKVWEVPPAPKRPAAPPAPPRLSR